MGEFFKSWRFLRLVAFLTSLGVDGYVFYKTEPFSPQSFMWSGIGAVLLFLTFFEIALHMRGQRRIRAALDGEEKIAYQTSRHLWDLLVRTWKHPAARYAIWIPVLIAVATTVYIAQAVAETTFGSPEYLALLPTLQYACAGYLPLLVAVPFVLEHGSEWRSWQCTLVVDTESNDPRLVLSHGVLEYNLRDVSLERTVTTDVHQGVWGTIFGIGSVELRETAGGEGEKLERVWKPRRLRKEIRSAINRWRKGHRTQAD